MKNIFYKNFSKLHKSNKGYVAIILAVFLPLALSLFYLYVSYSSIDSAKTQTNIATRDAALAVANNYATYLNYEDSLENFNMQKKFLSRKAALTFNATLKSNFGLTNNALELKKETVSYLLDNYGWVETSFKEVGARIKKLSDYDNYKSFYDPDYEEVIEPIPGRGIYVKNSNSGEKSLEKYTPVESATSYMKLDYVGDLENGLPKIKVTSSVVLDTKGNSLKKQKTQYTTTYYAEPAQCNADIVIAIPTNKAAFTQTNDINDSIVGYSKQNNLSDYINTPIYEIKNALRMFVKRFMFFDGLRMGIIPYSGKISANIDYFPDDFSYLLSDWPGFVQPDGTKPTIPIYDSYKTCGISGESINNDEGRDSVYFGKWNTEEVGSGIISVENVLEDPSVTNKFRKHPTQICYGGNISTYSMRCKIGSKFFPNPYPVLPLNYDIFRIYRYLNLIAPFDLKYLDGNDTVTDGNLSNFLFLPFLWGDYLLSQKWTGGSDSKEQRKKILIIFSNASDLFAPGELTYLGFDNDASYVSTIEGERLDFDNNLNDVCSKGMNSLSPEFNANLSIKNYIKNTAISIPGYRGEYVEDGNYTLNIPEAQNCRLAIKPKMVIKLMGSGEHQTTTIVSVKLKDSLNNVKINSVTSNSEIEVSDNDSLIINYKNNYIASPIIAQFDVYGMKLELEYPYSASYSILSDGKYVYLCKNIAKISNSSSVSSIKVKITRPKEKNNVLYDRLAYFSNNEYFYTLSNTTVSISGLQYKYFNCFKKYNAKVLYSVNYKNYITHKNVDAQAFVFGATEHCCGDSMPSRGYVMLKKHYQNIIKILFRLYGRKEYKLCGNSDSPNKLKLFVSDSYDSNKCKKRWEWKDAWSDSNLFGECNAASTNDRKYRDLGLYSIVNSNGKSGQYITFEAIWSEKRGSAYITDVKIDYKEEVAGSKNIYCYDSSCSKSIVSHLNLTDDQESGITELTIHASRNDSSKVSFSYNSSVSLQSKGNNLIIDNGNRVESVNIYGCQAFFIDKSWLSQSSGPNNINIRIKNCRILSVDVSNNITCFKSKESSHFMCVENNLDKIIVELNFDNANSAFKYPATAIDKDIMIKFGLNNGQLRYDSDQLAWVSGDGSEETLAIGDYIIDSSICDTEQGQVTFTVAPVDKWIKHGNGNKQIINTKDFGNIKLNYNGLNYFHESKSAKIKFSDHPGDFIVSGAKITGYEILNYGCDLGKLGCMPSFHIRVWKPSVYWNSCTQKGKDRYPKGLATSLGKYLDSSNFNYTVKMTKNALGCCLTKNHVWIEEPRNENEVCTLYGYIAYCNCNELHSGVGRLGYPCFFANRYSGSNNQNPRYQYNITGGWTGNIQDSCLMCENNPLNPNLPAEGQGRLKIKLFICEPFLTVNGVKTTVRESMAYTCLLRDNKNSSKNILKGVKINALKLLSIKYEGRNPIMYDRPSSPSKNARWIDFSSTVRGAKKVEPARDKGIYNSFSGEESDDYNEIYRIAKENYKLKKSNLESLGIKVCEGIDINSGIEIYHDDDDEEQEINEDETDCYNCNINGFGDPCSLIKTDEVVCPNSEKTYTKWKEAKKKYAEAYKNYAESFGKLIGLEVRENPSWNIDTDPVVGNEMKDFSGENYSCANDKNNMQSNNSSENIKKGYIECFISDSGLYNAYYRYNKAKMFYEKLANNHSSDDSNEEIDEIGCDIIPPDTSNLPYTEKDLPVYCKKCRSTQQSKSINHLDLEACYVQMEEQISVLKLEYYKRLGLNTTSVKVAENNLTFAENKLDEYLEKGNGVFLNYYNTNMPVLDLEANGKKENQISVYGEIAVEKWIVPGLEKKELYNNRYEYQKPSQAWIKIQGEKSRKKLHDLGYSSYCGSEITGEPFLWQLKVWCYKSSEGNNVSDGPYIYPFGASGGDPRFLTKVLPSWDLLHKDNNEYVFRDEVKGNRYYEASYANSELSIDDYLVGCVICANKNNPIKKVITKNGEESLPTPFAPNGYLNPCMERINSNGDVICSNLCEGEVKKLNDEVKLAEVKLAQVEDALEEEYKNLNHKVAEYQLIMDESYDEFIKNGVSLEIEAYDSQGNAIKYFAGCLDGEDNPETKMYQQEAVVCSEKCQKKKEQFNEALKEYNEALDAYKTAKNNKKRYDNLALSQSNELIFENNYFRTNKENALLALYLLKNTGDLSLILENFYNQDNNIISVAASYDSKNYKPFAQLTGRSGIFKPYDPNDTLDLEEILKSNDPSRYDSLTGCIVKVMGSDKINSGKTRLVLAEFTNPINRILSSEIWGNFAQRVEATEDNIFDRSVNVTPTNMLKQTVLPKIIEKIKNKFDDNYGKIYFINYRWDDEDNYIKNYADSKLKVFSANTPEELNKILMKISQEIETFAESTSAKVYAE